AVIRTLTDANINKLYQPWRSFAAIINKCLTEKSSGYDSLRLSQAQIIWGLYHKRNIDYAYLMWEDFVYQVEHKNHKKSNEMYYPRFTKVIIHHFMLKDPSIPRRNKVNWHYVRDDHMFSTIKLVAMTEAQQLRLVTKKSMKQTHISQASGFGADKGTGSIPGVPDAPTDESEEELSWNSTDDEGADDKGKDDLGLNIGGEEGHVEEEEEDELYRDVNINQGSGIQTTLEVEDFYVTLTLDNPDGMELIFETTSQLDVQTPTSVAPLPITTPTMTPSTIATITITSQAPILPTTVLSNIIQNLPNFGLLFRFDDRLRSLEAKFSKAMQTNQFARAVSAIPGIVHQYMDQRMNEAAVNEQLEAEVLTRSSHSSRTSYDVAADLSEMELKKILIEKMEGNKSIQGSDEQRNLYKALDEEPSARPDRGSKRRREGKEPESASTLTKTATRSASRSTQGSRSRQASASEFALAEEPMQTTSQMEEPSHLEFDTGKPPCLDRDWNKTVSAIHGSIQPWISELAKQTHSRSSFNELVDTPLDFSNFLMNRLKVDTLTSKLLARPTYELMKGSCKSFIELEYHLEEVFKATTDQLDWVNPEVKVAIQIQSDRLCDEAQRENDEFLRTVDENIKKIIKEQVKEQVKVQVFKILPRIEQAMNEQLEAKVLTRSSHSSKTSYAVAADLSEMELKKILIEKMEGNKSIQCSDEQRNLYKALVEAYESDNIILDTYREIVTLKRRRDDDADKDEEPSAGPDRGSKRRKEGNEPESASAPTETTTRSADMSTQGSRSRQASASKSGLAEEPMQTTSQMEEPSHPKFDASVDDQPIVQSSQHPECIQPWISKLAKQADIRSSFNELMDTPLDFSNFLINRLKVDTLTPKLLAGPTYELMKGSCKSLVELEYHLEKVFKATTDQLYWVNPEGQQYPHNLLQLLRLIPNNRGRRVIPFQHFINNDLEYLRGGKLTNLTVQECFAFNVSLRMFTRSIVIQRRMEDLQLGVESYQKKLNLTKPDTYRSDLKHKKAYTASSNLRGFIYQNKDKKNRLVWIDKLHKFSDGTLTDVRTALDDRLKGIRMRYLPQTIWRKSDKDRASTMIQAIDKKLKTRRIVRSLERFVGERLYEGDFRMLQRTI
nr:hypothetical protein [Tanacetum cinerariifolium]